MNLDIIRFKKTIKDLKRLETTLSNTGEPFSTSQYYYHEYSIDQVQKVMDIHPYKKKDFKSETIIQFQITERSAIIFVVSD